MNIQQKPEKPLNQKAYGSIPHLPGSRRASADKPMEPATISRTNLSWPSTSCGEANALLRGLGLKEPEVLRRFKKTAMNVARLSAQRLSTDNPDSFLSGPDVREEEHYKKWPGR